MFIYDPKTLFIAAQLILMTFIGMQQKIIDCIWQEITYFSSHRSSSGPP